MCCRRCHRRRRPATASRSAHPLRLPTTMEGDPPHAVLLRIRGLREIGSARGGSSPSPTTGNDCRTHWQILTAMMILRVVGREIAAKRVIRRFVAFVIPRRRLFVLLMLHVLRVFRVPWRRLPRLPWLNW